MLVNPSVPAKDYSELLALIKASPDKYEYATSGTCGSGHMLGEQFKLSTGTSIMHVPYRGAGPAAIDVISGHVPILIDALPSASAHIKSGKLRPIVLASAKRVENLPDTPTFADVGIEEANEAGWYGLVAPAGRRRGAERDQARRACGGDQARTGTHASIGEGTEHQAELTLHTPITPNYYLSTKAETLMSVKPSSPSAAAQRVGCALFAATLCQTAIPMIATFVDLHLSLTRVCTHFAHCLFDTSYIKH